MWRPAAWSRSGSALSWRWLLRWSEWRARSSPEKTGTRCSPGNQHRGQRSRDHRSTRRWWREQRAAPGRTETAEDGRCLRTKQKNNHRSLWRRSIIKQKNDFRCLCYRSCVSGRLWCLWGHWRSSDEPNIQPSSPQRAAAASTEHVEMNTSVLLFIIIRFRFCGSVSVWKTRFSFFTWWLQFAK